MSVWTSLRRSLLPLRPAAGLVLAHHRVGESPGDRERELVPALSTRHFEERLDVLARRYRVVPASEVLGEARASRRRAPIPIALTFDDDLYSHLDVIAPILLRRGFPATFFVGPPLPPGAAFWWEDLQALADEVRLPSHLDSLPEMDLMPVARREPRAIHGLGRAIESLPPDRRDAVAAELHALAGMNTRRRLDAEAMVSLVEAGFELGFHTRHHYLLTTLDDERLTRELTDGRGILETIAKRPIAIMAYPHGKADTRVAQAARAAGFGIAFTGGSARVDTGTDPLLVPRTEVPNAPLDEFQGRLDRVISGRAR